MADRDFGVKRINLIGSSGTPKITSPTALNLNAPNVAISTNITIGGKVQSDVIVGSGFSVGIGTTQPTTPLHVNGSATATGGFVSIANTTPIKITLSGTTLTFTADGIGSTSLTLS
tara:strand:- start:744 stop:1091 length:348 start_codon:yes stop_codon:yes gene_type:complete